MVTNVELAKKMGEKMKEVVEEALWKQEEEVNTNTNRGKKKVSLEDMIPKPIPPIHDDQEPFLKVLKDFGGM